MGSSEVLTLSEAAKFIRMSQKTLGEMAREGRMPCQRVGREWRFLQEALENWLSGNFVANLRRRPRSTSRGGTETRVREPLVQYGIAFPGFRDTAFPEKPTAHCAEGSRFRI